MNSCVVWETTLLKKWLASLGLGCTAAGAAGVSSVFTGAEGPPFDLSESSDSGAVCPP